MIASSVPTGDESVAGAGERVVAINPGVAAAPEASTRRGREVAALPGGPVPRLCQPLAASRAQARCGGGSIWIGPALSDAASREYRLRAVFECGKLDPQVADTPVLAPFPLMLASSAWEEVARLAEGLSAEAMAAERELLGRADLHRGLALSRAVRGVLGRCSPELADAGPRFSRLDFHWAADEASLAEASWRLSEINADVPGGLIEAGPLARLMVELGGEALGRVELAEDPAMALAAAMGRRLGKGGAGDPLIALVHATAYADDFQVMRRVQECLSELGLRSVLAAPDHLAWPTDAPGATHVPTGQAVDAVIRFFPAEWLPELGGRERWEGFFGCRAGGTGPTPGVVLSNPATALLTQSKRWSLLWDRLGTRVPTWRRMLPETRDPRELASKGWRRRLQWLPSSPAAVGGDWVLKPAMGRVGEGVLVPGVASRDERGLRRAVRMDPASWVAQRRFHSVPLDSPLGPLHVCLGVYVVDGRAAGLYARASTRALIDQGAYELPVLIDQSMSNPEHELEPL